MAGTVLVRSGNRMGSGFFISPDGLLLTASHVLSAQPTVELRDGSVRPAVVVRRNEDLDLVLLRAELEQSACLPLARTPPAVGSDAYVIGAPAGEELAFSLTRGVISGRRELLGREFLQTDASINPGNSGGPLLNDGGEVIAIASWKLAGVAVEGVAFGVPISAALRGLALEPGLQTSESLATGEMESVPTEVALVEDEPDPIPVLDPGGEDELRAYRREQRRLRQHQTPDWVKTVRWGGVVIGGAGAALAAVSAARYETRATTRSEFETLRLQNDVGWALAGVGVSGFISSFLLAPRLRPTSDTSVSTCGDVELGPSRVLMTVRVRY
jgi:hypothetical protein